MAYYTLRPPRGSRNQTFSDGFGFVLLCFALFALFCFVNLFYLAFLSLFTQCLAFLCLVLLPSLHFLLGSHAHTKNKKVWYSIITLAKFGMVSRRLNFGCLLVFLNLALFYFVLLCLLCFFHRVFLVRFVSPLVFLFSFLWLRCFVLHCFGLLWFTTTINNNNNSNRNTV